jgi:hypothetical protein
MPHIPMRCLFVNWKQGDASQFSVPDDYHLPPALGRRFRKPRRLTVLDLDANAEVYLDRRQIRSAMVLDIAPDRQVISTAR